MRGGNSYKTIVLALSVAVWFATACSAAKPPPPPRPPEISISVKLQLTPGTDVIAPEGKSGAPGDTLYYQFTVQNTGSLATSYRLSLQSPSGWSASLPLHGSGRTGTIQPGQTEIVPVAVTIPTNAPVGSTGTTTLTATADQRPRPTDSAGVVTTVVPGSELPRLVTAPPGQSGTRGATSTYQFELKNIGLTTSEFRISVSSSPKWKTSLPLHSRGRAGPLVPGQTEAVPVVVQIPSGAAIGTTCKTTLSAIGLATPRITGQASVTTIVVAASMLSVNLSPTSSADASARSWQVTLSYEGAPRRVRLAAQSVRGWAVTFNGRESLELDLPSASAVIVLELRAPAAAKGEDFVVVSAVAAESSEVLSQSAAVTRIE